MAEIHRRGIDVRELDTVLAEDFEFDGEMEFSNCSMVCLRVLTRRDRLPCKLPTHLKVEASVSENL